MSGYKIKEFPQDNGFWRIDWLGQIQPNIDVHSEPTINVLLTKLQDDYSDPLTSKSLTDQQATKTIGLGQLPLVRAGSIWKNGQLHAYLPSNKLLEFEVDTNHELSHHFKDKLIFDGEAFDLMPKLYYPVRKHYPKIMDAPVAVFPGNGKGIDYYIIPRFELLRFYYVCSSTTAFYVWEDTIGLALNQEKSAKLAGNDVRIHLRRNMLDKEAYMLGRWFVSDEMRQEVTSFHNKRAAIAANRPGHEPVAIHPDIGFPFKGKTKLKALGKRMKLHSLGSGKREIWAFLALHLQHCLHPMPYRDLIVDRDNSNQRGENWDDPDLLPAWSKRSQEESKNVDGDSAVTLASDEEPRKDLRTKTIDIFEQQFDLQRHRLVKEEVEVQKYRSAVEIRSGASLVEQYGTGEGTYAESSTGPVKATSLPDSQAEKALITLQPFIDALQWIRAESGALSVVTLGLGSEHMIVGGETLYLLPPKIKGKRSWHRINSEPPRSRGVMVAKITFPGHIFYLIEIERKAMSDSHSTLVLAEQGAPLTDTTLKQYLIAVARERGWSRRIKEKFPHLSPQGPKGVSHDPADSPEKFGKRLIAAAEGAASFGNPGLA